MCCDESSGDSEEDIVKDIDSCNMCSSEDEKNDNFYRGYMVMYNLGIHQIQGLLWKLMISGSRFKYKDQKTKKDPLFKYDDIEVFLKCMHFQNI
jgi:hypothetical protein